MHFQSCSWIKANEQMFTHKTHSLDILDISSSITTNKYCKMNSYLKNSIIHLFASIGYGLVVVPVVRWRQNYLAIVHLMGLAEKTIQFWFV